jgi:hypothetical protein
MATSLFDRIVPAGKDAIFPFQMSAASLSTTPSVYQIAGSDGAKTTVGSGVSVIDDGGGLYRLKVLSGNMAGGNMYFATVSAGSEVVRVPMWSFSPPDHIADVLSKIGGSGGSMSFGGILAGANNLQGAIDLTAAELGDFSAAGITGSPASAAAAMKILFDEIDQAEEKADSIAQEIGDVSTKTFSSAGSSSDVASALAEIYVKANATKVSIEGILGSPAGASVSADIAAIKAETATILADTAELQADWANGGRLDLIIDELTAQGDANETKLDTAISAVGVVDGIVDDILVDTADMQPRVADMQTKLNAVKADLDNGGRLDLIFDELTAQGDTNEGKLDVIDGNVDQIEGMLGALSDAASADYATDKTAMGMIRKLGADVAENQADLDTILADTNELQGDWANGGRLDLLLDGAKAAAEAARDDLANGTDGLGALKGLIDANQVDLDAIIADLGNGTDGLGALKALIDANQVDLDAVIADLSNGTDGLGALKALIDTVNSDLSNGTDGLGALKALIDTVDGVVDATKVVVDAQESKAQADTRQTALIAEHDATQATLGAPAGSSVSADIAAAKAVIDTLSLQVNAVLQPMVPAERFSGASAKRISIVVQTIDGATGALDDMDQAGTPAGQMYIKILDGAGSAVTSLYDAASGGSALASADATIYSGDVNGYKVMNRLSVGFYQAYLEISAYAVESYDVLFYAQDSDPNTTQTFRAMRQMEVRSPVMAQFSGGAF